MLSLDGLGLAVLSSVAGASIRAAILAAIAALVILIMRKPSASLQHALWTVVAASMLTLPFVSSLLPQLPMPGVLRRVNWGSFPGAADLSGGVVAQHRVHRAEPIVIQVNGSAALTTNSASDARRVVQWPALLAAVYIGGVFVMIIRLATGLFVATRLVSHSSTLRNTRANESLQDLAIRQRLSFPWPSLYQSNAVSVPVVVGCHPSAVVLPQRWHEWDEWKLRAVLALELTHVRRRDSLVLFLAGMNKAVFWFHPLAWWLEKRLSALCEQASDDAAVIATGDAVRYAGVVLDIARDAKIAGRRLLRPVVASSMAGVSQVSRRVHRLLEGPTASSGIFTFQSWRAVILLWVPLVTLVAAAQISQPPSSRGAVGGVARDWQWTSEGSSTTAEDARRLEQRLAVEPGDLATRAKLIAHYLYNANFKAGAPHVLWVIEHHPESGLAATAPVISGAIDLSAPEQAKHAQLALNQLWLRQAALHGRDPRVLGHAGKALMRTDPVEAERLLLKARELDRVNPRWLGHLARLYADAVVDESYQVAGAAQFARRQRFDRSFAARAKGELDRSVDADLLGTTGTYLAGFVEWETRAGQDTAIAQAWQSIREYASSLLKRAVADEPTHAGFAHALRKLDDTPAGVNRAATPVHQPINDSDRSGKSPNSPYEIPSEQQKALLVLSTPPIYPPLARKARLQGAARFRVRVGADGRVRTVTPVDGHPLLMASAEQSVRTYVYTPALINGQPVEVEALVEVQFSLSSQQ